MARERSTVREQILEAAMKLLRESGVKKLAQPQVARAAGVPQGHLTYYFPRKFDLLVAVVERFMQKLEEDLGVPRDGAASASGGAVHLPAPTTEPALRARIGALANVLVRDRQRVRTLLGIIVEADTDPGLREGLLRGATHVKAALAQAFGRPVDDVDTELALAMFWGLGLLHLTHEGQRTDARTDALLERLAFWLRRAIVETESNAHAGGA